MKHRAGDKGKNKKVRDILYTVMLLFTSPPVALNAAEINPSTPPTNLLVEHQTSDLNTLPSWCILWRIGVHERRVRRHASQSLLTTHTLAA